MLCEKCFYFRYFLSIHMLKDKIIPQMTLVCENKVMTCIIDANVKKKLGQVL